MRSARSCTLRCCDASHRPYPPSGSGAARADSSQRVPSAGAEPASGGRSTWSSGTRQAARSRVRTPSIRVTRTGTCQPSAPRRGSATTVAATVAAPPRSASCGRAPSSRVAARAAAAPPTTSATSSTPATPRPTPRSSRVGRRAARPTTTVSSTSTSEVATATDHGPTHVTAAATRAGRSRATWRPSGQPTLAASTAVAAHTGSGPSRAAADAACPSPSVAPAGSRARHPEASGPDRPSAGPDAARPDGAAA